VLRTQGPLPLRPRTAAAVRGPLSLTDKTYNRLRRSERVRQGEEAVPFNIGGPELIIVLVIILIIFGAGKLPEVLGQMGKGVSEFKKASSEDKPPTAKTTTEPKQQ
jgi:sec-independent protein translocase protein TatA